MLPELVLLPPLGHKEAIGTLGYSIASKLEDQLAFGHSSVDKQTDRQKNTGLYNIDMVCKCVIKVLELSQNFKRLLHRNCKYIGRQNYS